MESDIIKTLDFNITRPSSLRFYDRYTRIISRDEKVYYLGRYLLELALVDYKFIKYSASNIAASSIYLAMKIFSKKDCWNSVIEEHSGYSESMIRICAKDLCLIL